MAIKKLSSRAAIEKHEQRGARFEFLAVRLSKIVIEDVWDRLEVGLTIGEDRINSDRISRALDEAEKNLRSAGMVLQCAIEEAEQFDLHYRAAYSEWAFQARTALEISKRDKKFSGQVTQEMVENWVAATIPEYARWRDRARALERNKNLCKHMFAAWESRGATLRKMADIIERRRGVDPNLLDRRDKRRREDD